MRAKVKTARKEASKLHGASAGFVSLVDRGANETPFTMIKSAEGAGAMGIKKRTDLVAKSHKKLTAGKKAAPVVETATVMAKMVFDQDHFATEEAVRDWIAKAEWDAEKIEVVDDEEGNFVARPADTTDESFTKMAAVEVDDEGVTAFVGMMEVTKSADEDDEDEEDEDGDDGDDEGDEDDADTETKKAKKTPAYKAKKATEKPAVETKAADKPVTVSKRAEFIAKAKEKVVKFNGWDAFYSKKSDLSEALKAGMSWDATPPGFYDVQAAFNGVVQTILCDETEGLNKADLLSKAAADYADLLVGMDTFFDGYISAGADTVAKAVGGDETAEKIAKWAEGYAQFVAGTSEAPVVAEKTVEKKAAPAATIDGTAIADLIAKAVAPLSESISTVTETVSKMAERRPTKKAADLVDSATGATKVIKSDDENTEDWLRKKQRKSLIG